jgi:hypothetical protein
MLAIRLLPLALVALLAAPAAFAGVVDKSFPVWIPQTVPAIIDSHGGAYLLNYEDRIGRMSAGGVVDASFNVALPKIAVTSSFISQPTVAPRQLTLAPRVLGEDSHGRILLALSAFSGEIHDLDASGAFTLAVLARLLPDGTLDASFGQGGISRLRSGEYVDGEPCYGPAGFSRILSDGDDVYLAGTQAYQTTATLSSGILYETGLVECAFVLKITETGSLDPTFGVGGKAWPVVLRRSQLGGADFDESGAIVLSGLTSSGHLTGSYQPSTAPDRSFFRARFSRTGVPLGSAIVAPGPPTDEKALDTYGITRTDGTKGWMALRRYYDRPYVLQRWDGQGSLIAQMTLSLPGKTDFTEFGSTGEAGVYAVGTRYATPGTKESMVFCRWLSDGSADRTVGPLGCADVPTGAEGTRPAYTLKMRDGSVIVVTHSPFSPQPAPARVLRLNATPDVIEYRNTLLDHYFYTYDGVEARGIDAGAAGPGWTRTGQRFVSGGSRPTCRFMGAPGSGVNSHFFTADPSECEAVKHLPMWRYEGVGFYWTPVGECAPGLKPIYRLYNNRRVQNDDNHRFVADLSLSPDMIARGWIQEGVAFCARP